IEEDLSGPRSVEALKALEASVARVSGQLVEGEERSRATLAGIEARLANIEAGADPSEVIEEAVGRLAQRLADAEARTGDALDSLRDTLGQLDQRMYAADSSVRGDMDQRLTALADELGRQVAGNRAEIAARLAATGSGPLAAAVEARLGQVEQRMTAVDQRTGRAIETMGREVLSMAETLGRRVHSAEQRSAEAIEQVGGEVARIAGAVENRLGRTDQLHAEALERLGEELGKITERLTDRIGQSERRAAQAIDDVGEQVAKVTERIEQRHERAASDLAERLRQSEERTQRLFETHLARPQPQDEPFLPAQGVEPARAEPPQPELAEDELPAVSAVFGAELYSRAEPVSQPALDPGNPSFDEEDFAHVDAFAPVAGEFAPIAEGEDAAHDEDDDEARAELAGEAGAIPDLEFGPKPAIDASAQLSTKQVIEQARAAARAAAAAPRPKTLFAGSRRQQPGGMRAAGLFAGLRARPPSTWQTALMVAGGAAFLSVGAAGVVLMEGPGSHSAHDLLPFTSGPRAAVALNPEPVAAQPLEAVDAHLPPAAEAPRAAPAAETAAPSAASAEADYARAAAAVEQKQPGALAKLKAIADGGNAPAQIFLARLYETGEAGVSQNLGEARRWTMRAAEAGEPAAMHNLALYYFRGEGGPADAVAAAQWFRKAAERGVVDSQFNLGLLYQSGSGVPRDLVQADKWFMIAANAGDNEARASAMDLQAKLPPAQLTQAEAQAGAFQTTNTAPATVIATVAAEKILGRLGYYKGRADASNPQALKLAVTAYQRDQGLAVTGALDSATVTRLSVLSR
ncbi:peptidoglycan-binding protein, partial [Phenylobacterium sp.]|uniref:peptidoglycan-binding protein n=1 Tax=Phenylobacterium sp. TaxID=1871053 RepID=UPI002F42D556